MTPELTAQRDATLCTRPGNAGNPGEDILTPLHRAAPLELQVPIHDRGRHRLRADVNH
jgi:hypothetical protein